MLGGVALHAWVWAAIFLCRDVYWTQCGDYFSALGLLAAGGFVASVMLLEVRPGWVGWHALGMACAGAHARTHASTARTHARTNRTHAPHAPHA